MKNLMRSLALGAAGAFLGAAYVSSASAQISSEKTRFTK